jgi:lipoyl(octanoyl) transferase
MSKKKVINFRDWGRIDFSEAWEKQGHLLDELVKFKRFGGNYPIGQNHYLIFCEHPPVYTLGRSGSEDNLLLDQAGLKKEGIEYYKINRGGDITYHGPGQLVVYPILDLDCFITDVHKYVRNLEEVVIMALNDFDIIGKRVKDYTGVWIDDPGADERKICAIGVHLSRWVTMHGLALNVNSNLEHFKNIIPCGIAEENTSVTSMENEIGKKVELAKVRESILKSFKKVFDVEIR